MTHTTCTLLATLAVAISSATAQSPLAGSRHLPQGVAAGDVDANSAVLWASPGRRGVVFFQIDTDPWFLPPFRLDLDIVTDAAVPAKATIRGLRADTRYYYRAFARGRFSESGTFRTAARANSRRGLRFGASGDWRGELAPYPAVTNVDERLDFFVALGDTIYADFPSPALPLPQAMTLSDYRIKNAEVYSARFGANTLGDARSRTAWFATIDDHEVINDFSGGASPQADPRFLPSTAPFINETELYRNGLRAFEEYNPIADERWLQTGEARFDGKPRLYRSRRFGTDAASFVLDARSFRDVGLPAVPNPTDPAQIFAFLAASFDPTRTMLGAPQLARFFDDLLAAERGGVTWKFVFVPEPIQNLGVIGASDRFEGYAAERNLLLAFIRDQGIRNVVFVAADLHGTFVNDVNYQTAPGGPQIPSGAFEVITGAVAFDAPLGPTLVEIGAAAGLLSPQQVAFYESLPRSAKDSFVQNLVDGVIQPLGYDPLGLEGSSIVSTLQVGSYVAAHTFGWTEFAIDRSTQALTVTTWGIDPYTEIELNADPSAILARRPEVVQQFVVQPQ